MQIVKLETLEYQIIFRIHQHKFKSQVLVSIMLQSHSTSKPYSFDSIETQVEKNHLLELCKYFLDHNQELKNGKRKEAPYSYFDYDMLYKVRAYAGEYEREKDLSIYSMLFLINTGHPKNRQRAIWLGGEMIVDSVMLEKFVKDVQNALDAIDQE